MSILPHKIGISKRILTSRVGLIVVAQLPLRYEYASANWFLSASEISEF